MILSIEGTAEIKRMTADVVCSVEFPGYSKFSPRSSVRGFHHVLTAEVVRRATQASTSCSPVGDDDTRGAEELLQADNVPKDQAAEMSSS